MKDLIIIGGGPTGINCAIEAERQGLDTLIIEKGKLVNSIYNFPTNMTFFSTSLKLEIADIPFISHNDKPTRQEALEYYRRLALSKQLNIRYMTRVTAVSKGDTSFDIYTCGETFQAKKIIVATGFYDTPRLLAVPGENLPKVKHYYDDAHPYIGTKLLIIGARNSACDVALETWQKGADVTMAIRGDKIYDKVKYWIKPNIENRIKEGSIKTYFNSQVTDIKEKSVCILTQKGPIEIENDYVLAMTGYKPDFGFLDKLGIKYKDDIDKIPGYNPDTLESNIKGMYLAGVILSGLRTSELFIENTRDHAAKIIADVVLSIV